MGYPTSVQTFTTKNAGDTIQPAHVNDLQTEVSAIENGLLNGPVSLPTSTLANLSVTGASTVAGLHVTSTASFDSSVTFAGNVTVTGTLTTPGLSAAKVAITSTTTIPQSSATWTALSWNVNVYDAAGLHSTSANSSRINLTSSGMWTFGAQVNWENTGFNSSGFFAIRVFANDTNVIAVNSYPLFLPAASSNGFQQTVSGHFHASDTVSYLTLAAQTNTSNTLSVSSGTSTSQYGQTHFWVQKVSN